MLILMLKTLPAVDKQEIIKENYAKKKKNKENKSKSS